MKLMIIFLAVLLLAGFSAAETLPADADHERNESSDQENEGEEISDGEEDTDNEDGGSFLQPYYDADEDSSGCWLGGCFDSFDFLRVLTLIDVRYNSDPFRNDGIRNRLGDTGNPVAFSIDLGLSKIGENKGYTAQAMFLSPSPLGIEALLHRVRPGEGEPEFTLVYAGLPVQFVFGSPLQLMIEPQLVFPREDHRWTLSGGGVGLIGEYLFLDGGSISIDYRLTWISNLPMHRGEARLSWYTVPMRLWAGYTLLRNCRGETLKGPCAGLGILL